MRKFATFVLDLVKYRPLERSLQSIEKRRGPMLPRELSVDSWKIDGTVMELLSSHAFGRHVCARPPTVQSSFCLVSVLLFLSPLLPFSLHISSSVAPIFPTLSGAFLFLLFNCQTATFLAMVDKYMGSEVESKVQPIDRIVE